jgi:hypothetical protein
MKRKSNATRRWEKVRGRCKGPKKNKENFTKSKMENKKIAYFLNKRKPDRLFAVIKRRGREVSFVEKHRQPQMREGGVVG